MIEPEWKRVVPTDKDLKAYLVWKWRSEGWIWDPLTGKQSRVSDDNDDAVNTESHTVSYP